MAPSATVSTAATGIAPSGEAEAHAPPFSVYFLAAAVAWPALMFVALGAGLRSAGFAVGQIAPILTVATLPGSLMFLWAPLVDASATRRRWFIAGIAFMIACLVGLFATPWIPARTASLAILAFCADLGATFAAAALKGLIAHQISPDKLPTASGWYVAGSLSGRAVAAAGTLWLITHAPSRLTAIFVSVAVAAACSAALVLTKPEQPRRLGDLASSLWSAAVETIRLLFTRQGILVGMLCVIPFGAGSLNILMGSIARDWSVSADLLTALIAVGAVTNSLAALCCGWLGVRVGHWRTYIASGGAMFLVVLAWDGFPHTATNFVIFDLAYRAAGAANLAALFAIIMATIGKGAASTKATALMALGVLSSSYPVLIEGVVHDRAGPGAMLLAEAGLEAAGLLALLTVAWRFGVLPGRRARQSA